tara:strand:+ start:1794 stop:2972 length:1179 start_codon:yes stop_codon:yes gene_type:complete
MKKIILLSTLIFLASCQTLGTLGETFQLIEEDPRAPIELDTNHDSFLDQKWSKDVVTPIIELGFFQEKISPNKFFDISGGKVYVIDESNLRIFDATSGVLRDVLPLENDKIMSGVTVGYNSYVYSDNEGNLYVHNLSSGELKWKKELRDIVISKALITPKNLFVQTSSDVLYAFDLQGGEQVWSKKAQAPLLSIRGTSSPVFFEGLVFANFSNGRLAAIRATDGIQLWEKPISVIKGSTELEKLMDSDSPAVAFNDIVFAANYNGSLTRFNIRGGEKVFSVDFSTSKPFILYKDTIIAVNSDDEIVAFDAINGSESWKNSKYKFRRITAPALYDDYIYFGDVEGYLHKIDPITGETVGLQATKLKAVSQIEASANKLIVQDNAGSVSAFELK